MHWMLCRPRWAGRSGTTRAMVASTAVVTMCTGLLVAGATTPAGAAETAVSIRSVTTKTVSEGGTVRVRPTYTARRGVSVRSATLTVRRSSTWMARDKASVALPPGTYRMTTKVVYRSKVKGSWSRARTVQRTQTLRVVTRPPRLTAPATPQAYRPADTITSTGPECGSTPPVKADGTRWVCTFSDEFSGSSLDTSKWLPQETATSGYTIGGECYKNSPNNVAVGGGALSLTVRKEAAPFTCTSGSSSYTATHTGGMVSTWSSFAQAYGRFEIRAAFPTTKVPGHHSALWLFPKTPLAAFPYSGEIDIAEMYSQWYDRAIPYVHYGSFFDPTVTNNYCMIKDVSAFHTYTLEWTPTTLTIAYDGTPCVTHQINRYAPQLGSAPFDAPFILVLTQGLGVAGNAPTSATPAVGTTKVDYVRVWK